MSAYMVKDKTINRVVQWLKRETDNSSYLKGKVEKAFGISTDKDGWNETVGKAIFSLTLPG
jgi:hypothetical protein